MFVKLYKAGANGVVVGTAVEDDYKLLPALAAVRNEFQVEPLFQSRGPCILMELFSPFINT